MSRRSYHQYCGLARALDVIGDRWNLLIVRQLRVAPSRYSELQEGLPGVATNLLADRLRDLKEAGVVERRPAHQGGASIYALTTWGAELRDPIEGLIRWSTPLMAQGPAGDRFRVEWLAIALPALLVERAAAGTIGIGIAVDGEVIQVRATPTGVAIGPHDGRDLDAVLHADPTTVLGLAVGALTLDDADVAVDGDAGAVRALFDRPTPTEGDVEQRPHPCKGIGV